MRLLKFQRGWGGEIKEPGNEVAQIPERVGWGDEKRKGRETEIGVVGSSIYHFAGQSKQQKGFHENSFHLIQK